MAKTILVTGVSGFIAKHVALQLLQKGYRVRGTLRALNKSEQVARTLGEAGGDTDNLEFASADLCKDEGWDEACADCDGVMHVASPFPMEQPDDRMALTPAARDGALRVLRASAKAERFVVTSSMVAMMYRPGRPDVMAVKEEDWSDPDWKALSAYQLSKTLAEKAVWEEATEGGFRHRVVSINPALVAGPALDDDIGTSVELIRLMMTGAYPALPPVSLPIVDVRDLATLHVRALETPEAGGRRLIGSADTLSLREIADAIREALPDYADKLPSRTLPAFAVRLASLFDKSLKSLIADLGVTPQADTAYVTALTGVEFRPAKNAVVATARSIDNIKGL